MRPKNEVVAGAALHCSLTSSFRDDSIAYDENDTHELQRLVIQYLRLCPVVALLGLQKGGSCFEGRSEMSATCAITYCSCPRPGTEAY